MLAKLREHLDFTPREFRARCRVLRILTFCNLSQLRRTTLYLSFARQCKERLLSLRFPSCRLLRDYSTQREHREHLKLSFCGVLHLPRLKRFTKSYSLQFNCIIIYYVVNAVFSFLRHADYNDRSNRSEITKTKPLPLALYDGE